MQRADVQPALPCRTVRYTVYPHEMWTATGKKHPGLAIPEGYFCVPSKIVDQCSRIGPYPAVVYLYLLRRADPKEHRCFPTYDQIAAGTGICRRKVVELIQMLSRVEMITIGKIRRSDGWRNLYTLRLVEEQENWDLPITGQGSASQTHSDTKRVVHDRTPGSALESPTSCMTESQVVHDGLTVVTQCGYPSVDTQSGYSSSSSNPDIYIDPIRSDLNRNDIYISERTNEPRAHAHTRAREAATDAPLTAEGALDVSVRLQRAYGQKAYVEARKRVPANLPTPLARVQWIEGYLRQVNGSPLT